jgi:hypothetical protein
MGKKFVIVICGIVGFLVFNDLLPYGTAFIIRLLLLIVILFICNRLIKYYNKIDNQAINDYLRANNGAPPITRQRTSTWSQGIKNEHYKFLIAGLALLVFLLWKPLSAISAYFFMMGDLMTPTYDIHPVVMWAVLGFFTGMIYGGYIALVKFRLEAKYVLLPAAALVVLVTLLLVHHSYFKAPYRPLGSNLNNETPVIEETGYKTPRAVRKKKRVKKQSAPIAPASAADNYTEDTAAINTSGFKPGGIAGVRAAGSPDTASRDSTP